MASQRPLVFIQVQTAWMLAVLLLLTVFDYFTVELFLVPAVVGFFVCVDALSPASIVPEWRKRLRVFILFAMLVFGYVVVRQLVTLLKTEVI